MESSKQPDTKQEDDFVAPEVSNGCMAQIPPTDIEKQKTREGEAHFHRLGWKRLTIVLIVQSIALGSLGLPAAFASLGMVLGVCACIFFGITSCYASYTIGQVKLKFPHVANYVDMGSLMGRYGTLVFSFFFVSLATLTVGSHCLTGQIALSTITSSSMCALIFGVASAIILFLLALPPSFSEMAVLGYIDFASIILAIGITMVATGAQRVDDVDWSPWPRENLTFSEGFVALENIVFAFGFASSQPSFMAEMHTPEDYLKSIKILCTVETVVYTLTGGIIYYLVGDSVQSPALLSAGSTLSRVTFGVALPVIFISGSINATAVCKYIHGQVYKDSVVRYVNTTKGWITWIGLVALVNLTAWVIAEAIPFFSELLSICAALFVSGLSFYLPPVMWFRLLKQGQWYSQHNLRASFFNGFVFISGVIVLICGLYASIVQLVCFPFRPLKIALS
ncbi:transmembrane amino acid transporter protein-domain-containing protein [Penicillium angulare]|uniref:Transmembrane amino acid transporter protein-domain-containing protein n=1 Tax=Penicillium angulare TaxID=116970 RepID=A0A9W9KKI1_9EURO|nr:transmembrane amino acid transporter protein-domain-containing protein [Penicillium angulare]